jgi:putative transposase
VSIRGQGFKILEECDLIRRNGIFYLIILRGVNETPEYDFKDILGVDLGINNIAVDSDKEIFDSRNVENSRQRYSRLRSVLQHVGTPSAKRKLKRLSSKERRFKKDTNHCIVKRIISKAKDTTRTIAIEDLKNIRSRVTVRREQRDKHSKWAFGELREFLVYQTKREGVPLKKVPKTLQENFLTQSVVM